MPVNTGWIDFRALRRRLDFLKVLEHYHVRVKVKGIQATGFCPLPGHEGEKKPSFSVNLEKRIFQCFGCGARGNVIDFACLLAGRNPKSGADVHDVALELEHRFLGGSDSSKGLNPRPKSEKSSAGDPTIVNPLLDFELKDLDANHPYLKNRGFTIDTIRHFGLGFCNRGMLKGRIAIPLHDTEGKLVGYAGRIVDDSKIDEENPKYRFPTDRKRGNKVLEFKKSQLLYNAHRIGRPVRDLIIVEGFPSVWWLYQHGYRNVVALMGSVCSQEQAQITAQHTYDEAIVFVFPDDDDAGRRCASSVFSSVGKLRATRYVPLPEATQPTQCTSEDLDVLLGELGATKSKEPFCS